MEMDAPPVSGDVASRRRQYIWAGFLSVLLVGIGHVTPLASTLGVYLLVSSLITMVAFINGLFSLVRYYSNRGTLYLYGGIGFLAVGALELARLLAYTTGYAAVLAGSGGVVEYLFWSGTINHIHMALIIVLAMWGTRGRQHAVVRSGRAVTLWITGLTLVGLGLLLFAPVPALVSWPLVPRPVELVPGLLWPLSAIYLLWRNEWQRDTFVHWLVMALIFASGTALLLFPFTRALTDSVSLMGQVVKLAAFNLVLIGLANSMFELVQRVESSRQAVQQLNRSLSHEVQVRREAEKALLASRAELAEAQQIAHLGSWSWSFDPAAVLQGAGFNDGDAPGQQLQLSSELLQILGETHLQSANVIELIRNRIHANDVSRVETILGAAIVAREDFETYCRIVRKDGKIRTIFLRGRRGVDEAGNRMRYRGTAQDLTDLVQTQQQLRETAELLAARNRDLEEFANIASHDLQEPLRKIYAFSDRVIAKYSDDLDATGRDYLDRVRKSALRMQDLIEDILALSRVNSRRDAFVRVGLGQIVEEVLEDLDARIEEVDATVDVGPLPEARVDAVQMRQLFQNLLSNALKFSQPEAPPVVRVRGFASIEDGTPGCTIIVEDEGIGFDPRYAERIFQPFMRLHGRAKFEGTGMGLAICRRIVERHGGQIRAESEPDQGSRFIITLPTEPANTVDEFRRE